MTNFLMNYVQDVIKNKSDESKTKSELLELGKKWCDIFCYLKNEGLSFRNLLLLVEFALVLPERERERVLVWLG
jgi:hypothetical protein